MNLGESVENDESYISWITPPPVEPIGIHVIGVHKGGTTRIYEVLSTHPSVQGTFPKQHLYFYRDGDDVSLSSFMESTGIEVNQDKKFIDATPDHFFDLRAVQNIAMLKTPRILLASIRNPVDRAYSHWVMNKGLNAKNEFLKGPPQSCIERSLYADSLLSYAGANFEGLGVTVFEEWTQQEDVFFGELIKRLDLDYGGLSLGSASKNAPYRSPLLKKMVRAVPASIRSALPKNMRVALRDRVTGYARNEWLTDSQKNELRPLFDDDIKRTSDMIGRNLAAVWFDG